MGGVNLSKLVLFAELFSAILIGSLVTFLIWEFTFNNRMDKMSVYFKSFLTRLSILIGILMYFSYAFKDGHWTNLYLIGISVFVAGFLPYYTKISDWLERKTVLLTGKIFVGKIMRFIPQSAFNLAVLYILVAGKIVNLSKLDIVGGSIGAAALTTASSQGLQYISIALSNRDIGNRYLNVTLALSSNVVVTAFASVGIVFIQKIFVIFGILFGCVGLVYSLVTDIMASFAPKGGIGVFFGTFNPAHKTHMAIVKKFMEDRKLDKVYIHPTVVPKMHAKFLRDGIIRIARMENGMRVYERTEKADIHINYFPTGDRFFEIENRLVMLNASIRDFKLEDKVEMICYPKIYEQDGFYGVIKEIRKKHKGHRIHGLHGSDIGGMLVRAIYDESIGIWPYTIVREDNISATAIRKGAKGMTSDTVTKILEILKNIDEYQNGTIIEINRRKYVCQNSKLFPIENEKTIIRKIITTRIDSVG